MEKEFNYVYVITNLVNGKQYVGDHSTNDLDDGYLGSGRPYFENAKKKYNKENFKKEILEFFETKQEAFDAQTKWINKYNTVIPNGYNISPAGGMQCSHGWSKQSRKKISKEKKGKPSWNKGLNFSEDTKEKMSNSMKGRIPWNKGKTLSKETKEKMSEAAKNKKPVSEETRKKLSDAAKNRKHSKKTKEKIRNSHIGKKHSDESKKKMSESHLNKNTGDKNPMYGKSIYEVWVEKYGREEADNREKKRREKLSKSLKGRTPWNKKI